MCGTVDVAHGVRWRRSKGATLCTPCAEPGGRDAFLRRCAYNEAIDAALSALRNAQCVFALEGGTRERLIDCVHLLKLPEPSDE